MTEKRIRKLKHPARVETSNDNPEPKGAWFSRLIMREGTLTAVLKGEL